MWLTLSQFYTAWLGPSVHTVQSAAKPSMLHHKGNQLISFTVSFSFINRGLELTSKCTTSNQPFNVRYDSCEHFRLELFLILMKNLYILVYKRLFSLFPHTFSHIGNDTFLVFRTNWISIGLGAIDIESLFQDDNSRKRGLTWSDNGKERYEHWNSGLSCASDTDS